MPSNGDEKVEQFFAWLPVMIGFRFRWLVTVRVRYVYEFDAGGGFESGMSWIAVEFLPVM
jgi:hypothetical protein